MSADIVFINGLSCGDGTQDLFIEDLKLMLGESYRIHRPDLSKLDRSSTQAAIEGIQAQFQHLKDPVVIGFSLGGLWASLLAREGFTSRVIAISPAVPSNWIQIDPLRLKLFAASLFFGRPFKFTYEIARDHLMQNVPDEIIRSTSEHFMSEPASLIRDYGFMRAYTKLSSEQCSHLRTKVSGLVITGSDDRMTKARHQLEFSVLVGYRHILLPCGHTPQLGPHKGLILREIANFVSKENVIYPNFAAKKAG
ncbi:MAG: alpha/beta hydrolase [Proteobacteria bacterium]|nr:MAG: alpha/beta hydrolase [Pseudomonadota bacterium]